MVGFIPIYKNYLLSVKIEIYHQTMRVIIKDAYNYKPINIHNEDWFFYLALKTLD